MYTSRIQGHKDVPELTMDGERFLITAGRRYSTDGIKHFKDEVIATNTLLEVSMDTNLLVIYFVSYREASEEGPSPL